MKRVKNTLFFKQLWWCKGNIQAWHAKGPGFDPWSCSTFYNFCSRFCSKFYSVLRDSCCKKQTRAPSISDRRRQKGLGLNCVELNTDGATTEIEQCCEQMLPKVYCELSWIDLELKQDVFWIILATLICHFFITPFSHRAYTRQQMQECCKAKT